MPESSPRIFVTRRIPQAGLDALAAIGTVDCAPQDAPIGRAELLGGVARADALVCMLTDRVDAQLLDAAPRLKVVANFAVGHNNLDLGALAARGIPASNTPGVLTDATAELCLGLLLDVCRGISSGDRLMRAGGFPGWGPLYRLGEGLAGKRLGLVGFGRIGQAFGRLARGLGMTLNYHQRHRLDPAQEASLEAHFSPLDALLEASDVVSLHAPLTPETRGLLGREALARMRRGAILLNTARGELVDEAALAEALASGHLAGAGLDVFEREPQVHPGLLGLETVVLSPHLGSATTATRDAMALMVARNVKLGLLGRALENPINQL